MPGPHLEIKMMQTFADVGGCDAWIGSWWTPTHQWWVGYHSTRALNAWQWPSQDWVLIGYEKWYQPFAGTPRLREAFYATPNPSMTPPYLLTPPDGHWHVCYSLSGNETWRQWVGTVLTEDANNQQYLKGGPTGPKGGFHGKGKGKAADTGKGKGGQGQEPGQVQRHGQGQEPGHQRQGRGHLSLCSGTALID